MSNSSNWSILAVAAFALLVACSGPDAGGDTTPEDGGDTRSAPPTNRSNVDSDAQPQGYTWRSPAGGYAQVAIAANAVCGRTRGGAVDCRTTLLSGTNPQPPNPKFATIAAGGARFCGVTDADNMLCWNETDLDAPDGSFRDVAVAPSHMCAVTTSGDVTCTAEATGKNGSYRTVDVGASADTLTACAREPDGTVDCWNGDGSVSTPSTAFDQFCVGSSWGCGITSDGGLACWGRAEDGATRPPNHGPYESIGCGDAYACAIRDGGLAECWGFGSDPYEDEGAGDNDQAVPLGGSLHSIACGPDVACGLRPDDSMACWGALEGSGR